MSNEIYEVIWRIFISLALICMSIGLAGLTIHVDNLGCK